MVIDLLGSARSGLTSHTVASAVLSGAAAGHDQVRDGSGWVHGALGHAHSRAEQATQMFLGSQPSSHGVETGRGGETWMNCREGIEEPSAISTAWLQSVACCPPAAYRPGNLPGALLLRRG